MTDCPPYAGCDPILCRDGPQFARWVCTHPHVKHVGGEESDKMVWDGQGTVPTWCPAVIKPETPSHKT